MENPYGCEICKKSFALPALLKQHMRTHSEQFKFYCQFCPAGFTTKEHLLYHERSHSSERPFECETCGKTFKQIAHLNVHNKIHTGERMYECSLCNKRFISNAKLKLHQRVHTGEAPYQCGLCDKSFTTGYNLRAHQARVHEKVKTHQCSDCDKLFFSIMELRNHKNLHSGERPYKCNECGKTFKKSSALGIHKRVHSSYNGFDCDICGKRFKLKSSLKNHANTHKDNTYECDVCGRVFNRAMDLKRHKSRMHTDSLSSQQSNICKKGFQLKSSLKRHESSHFTNIGDYSCEECERQFKTQRSLNNHKRMHKGAKYKCHNCNKEFQLKSSLNAHLVRHLTDKPFGCQFCSSSFKQSSDLKNHLLMHQYVSCSFCPLMFRLPTQLASHVRNLHPNLDVCHTEISADLLAEETCHGIDSADTEIYMFDNDDKIYGINSDSDTSLDSVMRLSSQFSNSSMKSSEIRNCRMSSRTDEKASVTFLFFGKLEGQQKCKHKENGGNGRKNGFNAGNEEFEIWDNGTSRNNLRTFKSNRNLSSSVNMTSNGNIPGLCDVSGYSNQAENIDFQRNTNGATDLNDSSRHHMIDLPKLSNYADTDNLLSWPSPQHINLLEHFDSSYEMELSESFDDRHLNEDKDLRGKKFIRNRRKSFGYASLNTSNAVGIGISNGQVNNDQGQTERKETIPDIVINEHDLDVDLTKDTNSDLEELNYSSDVIEEILGNNRLNDGMTMSSNTKLGLVPVHNGRGVDEHTNQSNRTHAIHFCEPIGNIISSNLDDMMKNLKDESMKTGSSTLNVVKMTNNSYGRPLVQDKPNNNSVVDVEHHRNKMQEQHTTDTTGAMGEQNKDKSHFWPKHYLNTGKFPKNNMKREIINQNMAGNAGKNLFQSLTIQPKKECVFVTADTRNQSDKVKDHDKKLKCRDDPDSEVKFKKKGKYIKADKNVSFFIAKPISGYSSSLGELSSEDSDLGDDTTISDSICNSDAETVTTSQDSDVETIATSLDSDDETMATSQDSDDDSMLDSYSADESTFGNSSIETCSNVSRIDTDDDTDYDYDDSRLEDENSMTDNCSSIETDDEIKFKIPYQKSHTQECLKKKDLWLKRNFKFKRNNVGSRNSISYVVYTKNYSDLSKLTIRRNVSKIDRKYGKNRYMTEEKIAGIRDVIKKKHSKIADYASDASTVKLDENEKLRIYKSDGVVYSSDVSTVKMEENEKLRILKSDEKNYSSDALSTKLDANFRSDVTCMSPGHNSHGPVYGIASPRYKTRYANLRKMGKTARQKSGDNNILTGAKLVKSHLNVQFNRIASSPRYKTRYAKLRLLSISNDGKNSKKNEKEKDGHELNLVQLNSENRMEDSQLNTRKSSFSEVKITSSRTSIKSNKPHTNIPTQLKPVTRSTLAKIINMSSSVVQPDMVNNISRKRTQKNELESPSETQTELSVRHVVLRSKVNSAIEPKKPTGGRQRRQKPEITKKMAANMTRKMENMTPSKMAENMIPSKMAANMATLKMANMTPSKMVVNMTPSNSVLPSNIESNISMEISEITSEHKRGMRLNTTERPTRSSKKNSVEVELKHVESKIVEENPRVTPNSNKTSNKRKTTDMKTPMEVKDNEKRCKTNVISERSVRLRKVNNKIKASNTPNCNMVTPKDVTDLLEDGTGNSKQCTTNVISERSVRRSKVKNKIKASNTPSCDNVIPIEVTDLPSCNKEVIDLSTHIESNITEKDISCTESEERHLERKRNCKTVDLNKENKQQNGTVCITKRRKLKQNDLPCGKDKMADLHHEDCEIKYFQNPEINIAENTALEINDNTKQKAVSDGSPKPTIMERTPSIKSKVKKRRKAQKIRYGKRKCRKRDNRNKVDLISRSDNNEVKGQGKIVNHTSKCMEAISTEIDRQCVKINGKRGEDVKSVEMNCAMLYTQDFAKNTSNADDEARGNIPNTSLKFVENSFHEKESCIQDILSKEILKSDFNERLNGKSNDVDENKMVKNGHLETERNVFDQMQKESALKNGNLETQRNVFDQMEKESSVYFNMRTSDIQNKLPYKMDGYIKSISNFIIPSFENTRLKCKERRYLFKQLNDDLSQKPEAVEKGLHAVQTCNDTKSSDNKVKCRERLRKTKSCVKQNIPKRSMSADSILSDLSQGSKRLKVPKNQENGGKRSSSIDSVIISNAVYKRHKKSNILCFKRSKLSSSDCEDDDILWEVSKCQKIPKHQKNELKRSSSFDSVLFNGTTGHHKMSKNNEKVTKRSKSSDHDLFNESEYHDENVNTDISSDFCSCGTMCGYKRPLISVSNSEMANMSSATIRHDISKLSSCKTDKIIPPKQTGSCSSIKRTCKELNLSSLKRSTGNKEVGGKSSNTEKDGRYGHSFISEPEQHFTNKNHTREKVCEFIQPIATNILPINEGSTHQHSENISIQSKTYEIWRHVISNQPIVMLERID